MKHRLLAAAMLVMASVIVACGGATGESPGRDTNSRVVPIATANAEIRDLPIWLESVGRVRSQRAITHFCWLPPLRLETPASRLSALTASCCTD